MHHIWGCDHYKTTLNAMEFKRVYKRRTDLVKDAMNGVPYGDRQAMVDAIMGAIRQGGLFAVDVDIVPTKIGQACHVWLPAATSGEMNLTSMNGERRMRLTERYMDPPGSAMPDCLIAARIANHLERVLRGMGDDAYANQFKGFDWQTEEDAFMDGYHLNAKGGEHVTYARLRAMGTNGFQEPAVGFEEGGGRGESDSSPTVGEGQQRGIVSPPAQVSGGGTASPAPAPAGGIVGTKRLYADGKFGTDDGKAAFMAAQWRGLEAPGKEEQKAKFPFLINNGRANHVWQSAYLDVENELVMDRWPYPYLEMHAEDMAELGRRGRRPGRGLQRRGLDPGDGAAERGRAPEGDVHAVRLPDRRAGQRRQCRRERARHPELQANLGQYPEAGRRAGGGAGPELQVLGVPGRLKLCAKAVRSGRLPGRPGPLPGRRLTVLRHFRYQSKH